MLSKDTPFFATLDAPLVLVKGLCVDCANMEMTDVRWRFFHFWKQIPANEQQSLTHVGDVLQKLFTK